jgi:catechol 2,3-dioxygenase-like lactoylglutathione lyase family enzyme
MGVGYVVLYVNDAERCRRFWVEQVGMEEGKRTEVAGFTVTRVGFGGQSFSFASCPGMMKDNPDGLDRATPSICFHVDDLEATRRAALIARGVSATEVGNSRWDAVLCVLRPRGASGVRGDPLTTALRRRSPRPVGPCASARRGDAVSARA